MPEQSNLQRFYHLTTDPFTSLVQVDTPLVGRTKERTAWKSIIDSKSGVRGCSLNFIIGDYGMGKTHSLYHIKQDCDKKGHLSSVIIKLLPEDQVKNFGMDFIRRIFKHLDTSVKYELAKLKKPKALALLPEHVGIIKKYSADDPTSVRVLTVGKVPSRDLSSAGIHTVLDNTETGLEFLAVLLSMLRDAGFGSLILCVDEAEYIFSQMTARKAALVFNSLRAMYDLPETPNLGLKLRPIANIIFFFAISTPGMERLLTMEKVEQHQGGPIQPLLTRIDKKISLTRLKLDETRQLIEEYLKTSRTAGRKLANPLIPYQADFVDYVYELTKGHPRKIVGRCHDVITEGLRDHVEILTREYAKKVFARLNLPTA